MAGGSPPLAAEDLRAGQRPFATQLHIHQSMSEGTASFRSHVARAREEGVLDVIWFTDHDWRLAYHSYIDRFTFDSGIGPEIARRPIRVTAGKSGEASFPVRWREWYGRRREEHAPPRLAHRSATVVHDDVHEGKGALRLEAVALPGTEEFHRYQLLLQAAGFRASRSLASNVRVKLAVRPVGEAGADARIFVRFLLSEQPPDHRAELLYWLGGRLPAQAGEHARNMISEHLVEVTPDRWNDLTFDLTRDAIRDGIGGMDNAMQGIRVGLEVRRGATAAVELDHLRIEHERAGDALLARAREIAAGLEGDDLALYVGQEISYGVHINAFGPEVKLVDYEKHPAGHDGSATVEFIHRQGGVALLDHPFGVFRSLEHLGWDRSTRRNYLHSVAARLIRTRGYGADAIEVGYRLRGNMTLSDHLELWDRLGAAGVVITGVGSSDVHSSRREWLDGPPNNWVTWIWAASREMKDLMEGLRAGACYFGDPARWNGRMDLFTSSGHRMGDVVVNGPGRQELTLHCDGLQAGWRVRLVRNGELLEEFEAEKGLFRVTRAVETEGTAIVRYCVHEEDGEPVACSNPLYFYATRPEGAAVSRRQR